MGSMLAVIGPGDAADPRLLTVAHSVGREVAEHGTALVCGGLGGVMEAACRGARERGGLTVGLLPGLDRRAANPYVDVAVPTGLGQGRNLLVVRAADAVIAVGGSWGTLSEVALACRDGKRVVSLSGWQVSDTQGGTVPGVTPAADAGQAVLLALGER
ncbi:MAG: TIGR00725 family protein [Streptosporangiales bacterium]|nr:TIGR00725 family protein [Streptosporangiales bacterium]